MASLRRTLVAALAVLSGIASASPASDLVPRQQAASPLLREVFQVAQPILGPDGPLDSWGRDRVKVADTAQKRQENAACQVQLMEYSFASSYGEPFVGNYTPPDCEFNRVIMNLTVTVPAGNQYDRLAIMYLGDTEVFRTSTAEPFTDTDLGGAIWTYWKDMTQYTYFWKQPQKIIFDLGNIVDETYTSPFNTVLTATFFTADEDVADEAEGGAAKFGPADLIIPISAHKGAANQASAWKYPDEQAVDVVSSFPRNARRAVFSISANGQDKEEFWWTGLPQSKRSSFPVDGISGYDAWREVQVFIDDHLVGVSWPFPTLFTGAMSPYLHRPVVGVNTFDLKEQEIDITPWLPLLCDGEEHTFSLQVVCLDDSAEGGPQVVTTPSYWVLTGKVFVWLDEDEASITTGDIPTALDNDPKMVQFQYSGGELVPDERTGDLGMDFGLQAHRGLLVQGKITTQAGEQEVSWGQFLNFTTDNVIRDAGNNVNWTVVISGTEGASGVAEYHSEYNYPMKFRIWNEVRPIDLFFYQIVGSLTLIQGLDHKVSGASVFPTGIEAYNGSFDGSHLVTNRQSYFEEAVDGTTRSFSNFMLFADQSFNFYGESADGESVPLYERIVSSNFDEVMRDTEDTEGKMVDLDHSPPGRGTPIRPASTRGEMRPFDTKAAAPGRLFWPATLILNPDRAKKVLEAINRKED
ncbi:hypothetical protein jhhlp_007656 [Lomentospora prolificans]|uniref:Peptide N-acetyl-beta-D-glucosaminyl asparaginase amidase A N-terminal domain-containing protein n=1 Tax=Lomentospora prolificans TaxID=41688 RepID=A0A2N3N072_9PEZI|nr:hypothetical protein jhhlp_007656 [Lomentospora prolificans]